MKMYFDYIGKNFKQYSISDVSADYIQFTSGGIDYVIDTTGELDIVFEENKISGRFKGNVSPLDPETVDDLTSVILNMDTSTFKFGLFEEGEEPDYERLEVLIAIGDKELEFEVRR